MARFKWSKYLLAVVGHVIKRTCINFVYLRENITFLDVINTRIVCLPIVFALI